METTFDFLLDKKIKNSLNQLCDNLSCIICSTLFTDQNYGMRCAGGAHTTCISCIKNINENTRIIAPQSLWRCSLCLVKFKTKEYGINSRDESSLLIAKTLVELKKLLAKNRKEKSDLRSNILKLVETNTKQKIKIKKIQRSSFYISLKNKYLKRKMLSRQRKSPSVSASASS